MSRYIMPCRFMTSTMHYTTSVSAKAEGWPILTRRALASMPCTRLGVQPCFLAHSVTWARSSSSSCSANERPQNPHRKRRLTYRRHALERVVSTRKVSLSHPENIMINQQKYLAIHCYYMRLCIAYSSYLSRSWCFFCNGLSIVVFRHILITVNILVDKRLAFSSNWPSWFHFS